MLKPTSAQFVRDHHAENNARKWQRHANSLDAEVDSLTYQLKNERARHVETCALANENAVANRLASEGNTVAGYTNNLAQEMMLLRNDLAQKFAGGKDGHTAYSLPFGWAPGRKECLGRLSQAQRKEINLRLMCRAEWYDWCMHADVMAKFGAMMVAAFLSPTEGNKHLRDRALAERFTEESRAYHEARDRAMNTDHGVDMRREFEEERYRYWLPLIRYGYDAQNNRPFPSSDETLKTWPTIRFDLHLPAGRLAKEFGVNIATGEKAHCFREVLAGAFQSGNDDIPARAFYI